MAITFITVSFVIIVSVVLKLHHEMALDKTIANLDDDIIKLCKEEWDRQWHLSNCGTETSNITHNWKYDTYKKWNQLNYRNVDPEKDCQTICVGMCLIVLLVNFCFFNKYNDIDEAIVPICLCGFIISFLGVLIGDVSSGIVTYLYKTRKKDIKYWILCISISAICIGLAVLLFITGIYEYESGG